MPVSWWVDVPSQRAFVVFRDPYTLADWQEAMLGIVNASQLLSGFSLLVDRRDASPLSTAFVTAMTEFFDRHRARFAGTRAAIVVSSPAAYGMARMTATLGELRVPGVTIEVFKDPMLAEQWLDAR